MVTNSEIMSSKSKVYFFFDNVQTTIRHRNKIKGMIEHIFLYEKRPLGRLNYVFCSDKAILEINRRYLKHDYYTDIITFDLSGNEKGPIIGEVYISVDRVNENARELELLFEHELWRVIVHGALHLCGYKDKTIKARLKMRTAEDFYLKKYLR